MTQSMIRQYLSTLPNNETVYYCPNIGNAGDSLIALATFHLFRELNIKYQVVNPDNFEPIGKTFIYAGGGNLIKHYHRAREIIQKYHRHVKKLIILPHTIDDNEDLIKDLGSNVDIILREEISFERTRKLNTKSNIMLMDDMAFSLNVQKILERRSVAFIEYIFLKIQFNLRGYKTESIRTLLNMLIQNEKMEREAHSRLKSVVPDESVLNSFRTDIEKTDIHIPANNFDLSAIFAYGTIHEKFASYACYRLLKFMNHYNEIRTNRLHISIGGALLGKQVKIYPNNYYKCEAIYRYSMKDRFPNVEWMG